MVSLPAPRNRHVMLGISTPSTGCSVSSAPLHPAAENNAFSPATRSWLSSGMFFILWRMVVSLAGTNWTLCARPAPHSTTIQIETARRSPRMVWLSYTPALQMALLFCVALPLRGLEPKLVLYLIDVGPRNFRIMREDGEPPFRDGSCIILLAVLDDLQRKQVIRHYPRYIQVPCGGDEIGNIASGL